MLLNIKRNVGNLDKFIRITGGVLLALIGLFNIFSLAILWNLMLTIFGVVILLEGIIGY